MNYAYTKTILIILDGFGLAAPGPGNAVSIAGMPFLNSLTRNYPSFTMVSSSLVVGLPWGKFGNSEVGHSAIGTGRIVVQDWAKINNAIRAGNFFTNPAFVQALEHCRTYESNLHLVGILSPGGIHGHEDHLFALLKFCIMNRFSRVFVHLITDGEDYAPTESLNSLGRLTPYLVESGARIATINGRAYGMDRVLNWPLTEKVWQAMVDADGPSADNLSAYIQTFHAKKEFDDEIVPAFITTNGKSVGIVNDNDALIFFNYRNDRMRQLASVFTIENVEGAFTKKRHPKNLWVTTMTRYASTIPMNAVAFEATDIPNTLGGFISAKGLKQMRIAEKEKESHVKSFFNGGKVEPYAGEEHFIVSSRQLKGREYVEHPEMSADKIVSTVLEHLNDDAILRVVNFANSDMIAHTGILEATVKGLQVLDASVQKIITAALQIPGYAVAITCDHGNSEEMLDPLTDGQDTQHSSNNVMTVFVAKGLETGDTGRTLDILASENPAGSLIDVAPTVLALLGFEKPNEMTGSRLI